MHAQLTPTRFLRRSPVSRTPALSSQPAGTWRFDDVIPVLLPLPIPGRRVRTSFGACHPVCKIRRQSQLQLVTLRLPPRPRVFTTSTAPVDHRQHPVISARPRLPSARATHEQPPSSRPTGLAPRRLGTHSPLFYVKSIFPSVFPAPSPPPSGLSIGECLDDLIGSCRGPTPRVDGRAPLDDSRPIVFEDVDRKASRTTLLGTPQGLRRRRPRRHSAWLLP